MRCLSLVLLGLFSVSAFAGLAAQKLESFTAQVSPMWKALKPACAMTLEPNLQIQMSQRLAFLDEKMIGRELLSALSASASDRTTPWTLPVWAEQEKLEKDALALENRESLREYFFKLQTQKPNPERAKLVDAIQNMSETLNYTLRKELWKTCHALSFSQMPVEQMEAAVDKHWETQNEKVRIQVKRELAAFYFFSFRQTSNQKLRDFAQAAQQLDPWVEKSAQAISEHYQQVRSELISVPFVINSDAADEPFLEGRPLLPSPSQGLLAP